MKETLELRVSEDKAHLVFSPGEGKRLGEFVRLLKLDVSDPRMSAVAEQQRKFEAEGTFFFAGWQYHRQYSKGELEAATHFHLTPKRHFEPAGEECGTIYDDAVACPFCKAGRRQVSPLRLDVRRIPRSVDFASTIASELVVSQRAARAFVADQVRGLQLHQVQSTSRNDGPIDLTSSAPGRAILKRAAAEGIEPGDWEFGVWLNEPEQIADVRRAYAQRASAEDRKAQHSETDPWYQIRPDGRPLTLSNRTRVGIGPFDLDAEKAHVCPAGDTVGLNVLSEITLDEPLPDGVDFAETTQYVGNRMGLLVPRRLLIVSQRFRQTVIRHDLRGFDVEVARFDQVRPENS